MGWMGGSLLRCVSNIKVLYALRYPPHSPSLPLFLGDTTALVLVGRYRISFRSSFHPPQSIKHQVMIIIIIKIIIIKPPSSSKCPHPLSAVKLCAVPVQREREREKKTRKIELQARQRASERAGVYPPVCTYCNYLRQCSSRPIRIGQPAGLGGRRKVYSAFLPRPRPRLEAIAVDM